MGVKSYVAGMQADAVDSAVGSVLNIGSIGAAEYKKAKDGKDKTDISVEIARIDSQSADFFKELKYDRNWESYEDKVDESFADIISNIENNELLSDKARDALLNDVIPQKREEALGKARLIGYNTQMTEIEVGVERHGDLLALDPEKNLSATVGSFEEYVTDLGVYNEGTIAKMVADFKYSTAPIKALQQFTTQYEDKYKEDGFSPNELLSQAENDLELDLAQKRAMRKEALAFQKNFDDAIDANAKETFQVQYGELAQARDRNEVVDADQYDALADEVPARFKSEVMKLKNTARSNNDDIITEQIQKAINTGKTFSSQDWGTIDSVYDPVAKNKLIKDVLVSEGQSFIDAGDLVGAINNLDTYDSSKVSIANKREAKGQFIKDYMTIQGDTEKIVEAMVNASGTIPTEGQSSPEFKASVVTAKEIASPLDSERMESDGVEYIEEQIDIVTKEIEAKGDYSPEESRAIAVGVVKEQAKDAGYEIIETEQEAEAVANNPTTEGNIDVSSLPVVDNEDGTVSTVDSISISEDGEEVLIPTIVEGVKVTDEEAVAHYHETGEHLGKFKTAEEADSAAKALHNKEELRVSQEPVKPKDKPNDFSALLKSLPDSGYWDLEDDKFVTSEDVLRQSEADEKQKTRDARLEELKDRVVFIGRGEDGSPESIVKPNFKAEQSQVKILEDMLSFIDKGYGQYIDEDDLSLIHNKDIRDDYRAWASDWQHNQVDDITTVRWLDEMRYDPTVTESVQRNIASTLLKNNVLTAKTAEKFATKSKLAENERLTVILNNGPSIAKRLYPKDSAKQMAYEMNYRDAVERAIINDPTLADPTKGLDKLRVMVNEFTVEEFSKKHITEWESLNKLFKDGTLDDILKTMESTKLNDFMHEAGRGTFNMFLNTPKAQKPNMLMLRAKNNNNQRNLTQTMDAVTKEFTDGAYDTYADLKKKGTSLEKMEILVNANFIMGAGIYEKALKGSFGLTASDVKMIGNNWAYQDPENPDIWFAPGISEHKASDKLAWRLYLMDGDDLIYEMNPEDSVDPKLLYEAESQVNAILSADYKKAYEAASTGEVQINKMVDMRKFNLDRQRKEADETLAELNKQIDLFYDYRYVLSGFRK